MMGLFIRSFALIFGYVFLYAPIVVLVIFSFNESKLVTIWGGFSTKWYWELFSNDKLLSAAFNSLKIAGISATVALIIGTLAGYVLARFGVFKYRHFFTGMISAPLVMPDIMIGISMLLLFVGMQAILGGPERGLLTIIIAHITFATAYVAIIVQSRLVVMERAIEEAAADLGARPLKTFFVITLPIIFPALISGWLLGFTLSLDDLLIASFVSGPGATTLPMEVYSSARLGLNPQINAVGTIIISIVATCLVMVTLLNRPKSN